VVLPTFIASKPHIQHTAWEVNAIVKMSNPKHMSDNVEGMLATHDILEDSCNESSSDQCQARLRRELFHES
jgi:hypothetical protein